MFSQSDPLLLHQAAMFECEETLYVDAALENSVLLLLLNYLAPLLEGNRPLDVTTLQPKYQNLRLF